jgi:hypothetical protein
MHVLCHPIEEREHSPEEARQSDEHLSVPILGKRRNKQERGAEQNRVPKAHKLSVCIRIEVWHVERNLIVWIFIVALHSVTIHRVDARLGPQQRNLNQGDRQQTETRVAKTEVGIIILVVAFIVWSMGSTCFACILSSRVCLVTFRHIAS